MTSQQRARKKFQNTHKGRVGRMYYEAKRRAKERGLEWEFELAEMIVPDFCPVLNLPMFFTIGKVTDNTPTIDRVDNTKGYTRDNIDIICYRANRIKNCASLDELVAITMYVAEHQTSLAG